MKLSIFSAVGSVFLVLLASSPFVLAQSPDTVSPQPRPTVERENPRSEAQFSFAYESLSNGYGDWQTASLDISHRFRSGQVLYGSLLATERFGRRDQQLTVGAYKPLDKRWTLQFEANVSARYRTLPKWSAFIGAERQFRKGWSVSTGYRRTLYRSAKVNLINLGVEKYFGNYRAAYTLYISNLQSTGKSASHRLQFNRYYGEHASSVGISTAFGRELESLGTGGVLQTDVHSIALSARHWFSPRWGANFDASYTKQGNFYNRRGASIGIRFRF